MTETEDTSILALSRGVMGLWLAVLTIPCVAVTFVYAPESWGLVRTLSGGLLLGAMSFYLLFINRILVDGASKNPDLL